MKSDSQGETFLKFFVSISVSLRLKFSFRTFGSLFVYSSLKVWIIWSARVSTKKVVVILFNDCPPSLVKFEMCQFFNTSTCLFFLVWKKQLETHVRRDCFFSKCVIWRALPTRFFYHNFSLSLSLSLSLSFILSFRSQQAFFFCSCLLPLFFYQFRLAED